MAAETQAPKAPTPVQGTDSRAPSRFAAFKSGPWLTLLALAVLWAILINELRIEWSVNPQYSYGWMVPLLALGLLFRRWQAFGTTDYGLRTTDHGPRTTDQGRGQWSVVSGQWSVVSPSPVVSGQWSVVLFLAAFLILPIRLFLEANPNWRTLDWLLALCTVALTLGLVQRALGRDTMLQFAFPVCLILVAVPWPPSIEVPVIQGLTRFDSRMVIEVMGVLGVPAIQHGNIIEVGTGTVGIDEACSGIRSFQSSLMISLFFGELYRMSIVRRLLFIPIGFATAMLLNVCRTSLLTFVAAKKGIAAISDYHDPAGMSIMIGCTLLLWAIGWCLRPKRETTDHGPRTTDHVRDQRSEVRRQRSEVGGPSPWSVVRGLSTALVIWLVVVEVGVEAWYRSHELRRNGIPEWALSWPPKEPGFTELPVAQVTREMLAYNEGHSGSWRSADGQEWSIYYFRWFPGKIAAFSARSHSPNVCLAAAGKQLRPIDDNRCPITIRSIVFPFRRYEFEENSQIVQVFHCLWEEQAPSQYFQPNTSAGMMSLRLEAVLQGRRNLGQRSLEIILPGITDPKVAQAAVEAQLRNMITVVPAAVSEVFTPLSVVSSQ